MAGVTAKIVGPDITVTSRRVGTVGNYIGLKVVPDPAGATGATTVSVSGLEITVKGKNAGTTITALASEILSAISGSADAQKLVTATLTAAQTGTVTGVVFTGAGGTFVRGTSGAESGSAVTYDVLGDATGAGQWKKQSGNGIDLFTRTRDSSHPSPGTEERQAAVSATGATAGLLAAGRTQLKHAAKGILGPSGY